jgi:hypothetical protein
MPNVLAVIPDVQNQVIQMQEIYVLCLSMTMLPNYLIFSHFFMDM